MKFILSVMLLLLSSYIYTPIKNDLIDVYISVEKSIQNDFIKITNNKIAFYYNSNYLFTYECDEENVFNSFDYLVINNEMHIVIKENNNILYFKYNELAQKVVEEKIEDYQNVQKIKLFYNNECINIVFSSSYSLKEYQTNLNLCILSLDAKGKEVDIKTYGGYLNEEIIDCTFKNDSIYLFLKRDNMSGGDFNNFGNYVLSIIKDDEIIKNVYFTENDYQNLIFSEEEIKIGFLNAIYSFDYNLNQKIGLKFERESLYSLTSFNKMQMQINDSELKIFDAYSNEVLYEYDYSDISKDYNLTNYYILKNSVYLIFDNLSENVYLKVDAFDTRNFISELNYIDGISQYNTKIDAWNASLSTSVSENDFNPSVDGQYEIAYNFLTYSKIMKVNVLEYQNVSEGGIYPLSYSLEFSGTAFLNGQMINYGYKVNKSGEYVLELYNSLKEKRVIKFTVNSNQIDFSEEINKKSDYVIEEDQSLFLKYQLDLSKLNENEELNLYKIIINQEEWKFWDYKNNILSIEINESEKGFKYFLIEKAIFVDKDGNNIEYPINEIVSLIVLSKSPEINLTYTNQKNYLELQFDITDGQSARYINIYANDNLLKKQHFKDGVITSEYNMKINKLSFTLVYELGDGKLFEQELFEINFDECNLYEVGDLNISFLESEIEEFNIKIYKNKNLVNLKADNKILYEQIEKDYGLIYLFVCIFAFMSLVSIIKYFHKIKKKKDSNNIYALKKI